jgi:hypothetical protein
MPTNSSNEQLTDCFSKNIYIIIHQSPDFSSKAVDLAAGELLEIATPGKGFLLVYHLKLFPHWVDHHSHILLSFASFSFTRTA